MRDVGLVPAPGTKPVTGGSTNEGAGELSASGEYKSLPVPSVKGIGEEKQKFDVRFSGLGKISKN